MDKLWLLKNYRKKLSVYFALFVLLSLWIIVGIYEFSQYINQETKAKDSLISKEKQIINVIDNSDIYSDVKEVTFRKILTRVFTDTILFSWGNKVISQISDFEFENFSLEMDTFQNQWEYKYYMTEYISWDEKYKMIIRTLRKYTFEDSIKNFVYFLLFSLPFWVLFYALWYFFVGKNLRPIRQTIRNLEDFTGNVNHEFKTPLSEIVSSLQLAKKSWKYKAGVDQSITSAKRLTKILDSMIGIVSITDSVYKKQKIDLVRYSKQIVRKYEKQYKEKAIEPIFVSYTKTNYKKINKEHYYTCFSNLFSNAIKYSNEDSKIYIRLKNNLLEIEDQWVGIDKKNQKKIFDRYFRENYSDAEWLWVWLSLVRKIVDINKWKIKLESKKDEWTKITIDFS